MTVKRYEEFLLESIIRASKDFLKILDLIKDNSKVAQKLVDLLGQDIKTNYNFIKISDDPSKLSFVPDNQATRKLSAGSSEEELFAAASNPTTIGRLVKSLFNSNKIEVSDGELDHFGNLYRSYATLLSQRDSVRVVSGDDIAYWYHHSTYAGRDGRDGTLNKSCMRHDDCQEFFDIYTKNPDVVKMLIKVDDEGKLEARALLWQTDKGPYLDRVYSIRPDLEKLVEVWAEWNHDRLLKFTSLGGQKLQVKLRPHVMYGGYPYMDTFCYYLRDGDQSQKVAATLFNYELDTASKNLYHLHDTEGGAERMDTVYSEYHDMEIARNLAVYSDVVNSWILEDQSVYSDYHNASIPQDDAVRSEILSTWLHEDDAVEVVVGEDGKVDYYPRGDKRYPYWEEAVSGRAYSKKMRDRLLMEWEGEYYDMNLCVFVKDLTEAGKKAFEGVYGVKLDFCTKLDEEAFGFETTGTEVPVGKESLVRRQYSETVYTQMVQTVRALRIPEATKKEKLDELAESDKFMRAVDRDYLRRNEIFDNYGGYEGLVREWSKSVTRQDVENAVQDDEFSWSVQLAVALKGNLREFKTRGRSVEEIMSSEVGEGKGGKEIFDVLVECAKNPALLSDESYLSRHVPDEGREMFEAMVVAVVSELSKTNGDRDVRQGIIYYVRRLKQ